MPKDFYAILSHQGEGDEFYYQFYTEKGAVYTVSIEPNTYDNALLDCQNLRDFAFAILVYRGHLSNISEDQLSYDPKVEATIKKIVVNFLSTHKENVLIYTLDSADGKQEYRNVVFVKRWFDRDNDNIENQYEHLSYFIDQTLVDGSIKKHFYGIFSLADNPNYEIAVSEFERFCMNVFVMATMPEE